MPRARINGINLYYEDGGIGAPVVFIHGGFPSLAMKLQDVDEWAWTWERDFAARFHFIWYDRRGCYRSDSPADGYALENQARDLAALLDHLQLDSAHVIGSSAGGPIAIIFAALWPHRVRSLILAGTGLEFFPEEGDPISDIIRRQIELLDEAGVEVAFDARPPRVQTSFESLWRAEEEAARGRLTRTSSTNRYAQHRHSRYRGVTESTSTRWNSEAYRHTWTVIYGRMLGRFSRPPWSCMEVTIARYLSLSGKRSRRLFQACFSRLCPAAATVLSTEPRRGDSAPFSSSQSKSQSAKLPSELDVMTLTRR